MMPKALLSEFNLAAAVAIPSANLGLINIAATGGTDYNGRSACVNGFVLTPF